jgi:hypothetical protein
MPGTGSGDAFGRKGADSEVIQNTETLSDGFKLRLAAGRRSRDDNVSMGSGPA